jgi:hypothetical protein
MARLRQPAMDTGRGDTRPGTGDWSDGEPDAGAAGWAPTSGIRRAWAVTRWTALIVACGIGVAVSFAIAIATLVTLLGSSL